MTLIKLLVEGGKMTPGPAVAQQLGPMGINMGKVISDINSATAQFKGITVPVNLDVDAKTKKYTITVLSPPTSELIKKELGVDKASGARLKVRVGNLAFEQIISVAKQKHDAMLSNDFISTLKSVLGTCQALGVLVDNKEIKEIMKDIGNGDYDALIASEKTDVSEAKKKELKEFFAVIKEKQDAIIKAEAETAAAAAAATAATATTTPAATTEAVEKKEPEKKKK